MAISATINKVTLNIADMDRHYYQSHEFTLAQHPSETDFRFMMRIIAFIFNANDQLSFTKGLCIEDEPELWQKITPSDDILLWVDLGQLEEKRIRKACARASNVIVYTYNKNKAEVWWNQIKSKLKRFSNLNVFHIHAEGVEDLVKRHMVLQCNIEDGEMAINDDDSYFKVTIHGYQKDSN